MKRIGLKVCLVGAMSLLSAGSATADIIVIDFEAIAELDPVNTQYAGVTFSNATVWTAGSNLNELENPPHSGSNVVVDDGGAISIAFASPVTDFGGYFTYSLISPARLTLTAFDSAHVPLGLPTLSAYSNNQLASGEAGSSPNEFLQLLFSNISFVTIQGELAGFSFTLDDVTYTEPTAVPEPAAVSLLGIGIVALWQRSRSRPVRVDNRAGRTRF